MGDRPIYLNPAATYPVLSYTRTPSGYFRGLVRPSSIKDPRIMLSGLVPDVNFARMPENLGLNYTFRKKFVYREDQDLEDIDITEESVHAGLFERLIEFGENRPLLADDATDEERQRRANQNRNHAFDEAIDLLGALPEPYDPARMVWGDLLRGSTLAFPENAIPATVDVGKEQLAVYARGTSSSCSAEIEHQLLSGSDAIIFPGAAAGAKVKARLDVDNVTLSSATGLRQSQSGNTPAAESPLFPSLYLFQGNHSWFTAQWPEGENAVAAFDQIILARHALQPTDPDAEWPTEYTADNLSWEIEFTVPRSRIIVPFFSLFQSSSRLTWEPYFIRSYVIIDSDLSYQLMTYGRCRLTILQIGTWQGPIN